MSWTEPVWLTRLLEDCGEEAGDVRWPMKLIPEEGRSMVWCLCQVLGVNSNGVPGQACRLLERYLSAQMRKDLSVPMERQQLEELKRYMSSRIILTTVSCIQLATKMNYADVDVDAKVVIRACAASGIELPFDVKEINDSEMRVFNVLGFRIPLWTSVEYGRALAVEVGLPQTSLDEVELVVDYAEYSRHRLDPCVRWAADIDPHCEEYKRASMRTLHLVAGCVLASVPCQTDGPDYALRLAHLTSAPVAYIKSIANAVLNTIFTSIFNSSLKRKSSDSELSDEDDEVPWKQKKE